MCVLDGSLLITMADEHEARPSSPDSIPFRLETSKLRRKAESNSGSRRLSAYLGLGKVSIVDLALSCLRRTSRREEGQTVGYTFPSA
jgi:hypothetical protein